jgi:hypothetical protein
MTALDTITGLISYHQEQIVLQTKAKEWLELNLHLFEGLPNCTPYNGGFDFENLKHPDVIRIISAFPGKWKKEPAGDARVNYSTTFDGMQIRCYRGEPPANCKIVYEEVEIPARKERRAKLVCREVEPKVEAPPVVDDISF